MCVYSALQRSLEVYQRSTYNTPTILHCSHMTSHMPWLTGLWLILSVSLCVLHPCCQHTCCAVHCWHQRLRTVSSNCLCCRDSAPYNIVQGVLGSLTILIDTLDTVPAMYCPTAILAIYGQVAVILLQHVVYNLYIGNYSCHDFD